MGRRRTRNHNLPSRMLARRMRSGKVYYYFDAGGRPRKELPLGSDYALAVKKFAELLQRAPDKPLPEIITFRYAAERYMRDVAPLKAPKSQASNKLEIGQLYKFFDSTPAPLDDIVPVYIRQYLDRRRAWPASANRERALFSHIWNKAREWGYTDKPNPVDGIPRLKEKGRDVYIEDDIFKKVWKAADWSLRDAMDLAYLTGQRPADVLKLQETDLKDGFLYVQQNKTGKKLRISVSGELKVVLKRIAKRKTGYPIHSVMLLVSESGHALTKGQLRLRFDAAREVAGVDGAAFHFRDLRAKALTDKAETADSREAQKQGGHGSVVSTERYIRNRRGDKVTPTK